MNFRRFFFIRNLSPLLFVNLCDIDRRALLRMLLKTVKYEWREIFRSSQHPNISAEHCYVRFMMNIHVPRFWRLQAPLRASRTVQDGKSSNVKCACPGHVRHSAREVIKVVSINTSY
jgi:hypothetical protein